jgi:hypothetical protein
MKYYQDDWPLDYVIIGLSAVPKAYSFYNLPYKTYTSLISQMSTEMISFHGVPVTKKSVLTCC